MTEDYGIQLASPPFEDDEYKLLSQANLLRIRGRWDEAIALCVRAMADYPKSVAVHSLLGDIYENQGLKIEAIRWYRLALALNPQSQADNAKLSQLVNIVETPVSGRSPTVDNLERETVPYIKAEQYTEFNTARLTSVVVIAVLVVIVTAAISASIRGRRAFVPPETYVVPTVIIPSAQRFVASAAPISSALIGTPDEIQHTLLVTLENNANISSEDIAIASVIVDPRTSYVVVSAQMPAADTSTLNKTSIILAASTIASTIDLPLQQSNVAVLTIRLSVIAASPSGSNTNDAQLLFTGDYAPGTLPNNNGVPSSGTNTKDASAFGQVWWSPTLTQPDPIPADSAGVGSQH